MYSCIDEKTKALRNKWAEYHRELSQWTLDTLVARTDTYGFYYLDKATGQPLAARKKDGDDPVPLTFGVLQEHWLGNTTVGLYSQDADDMVKCVSFDLDNHKGDPEKRTANSQGMQKLCSLIGELRMRCIAHTSDDKGGWHLRIPFANKIPYETAVGFGHWLLDRTGLAQLKHDGKVDVEFFPKNTVAHTEQKCGNYVRLILPKPGRTAYPCFWTGKSNISDVDVDDAARWLLSITGNDCALIPAEAQGFRVKAVAESRQRPALRQDGGKLSWADLGHDYYGDFRTLDWFGLWEDAGLLVKIEADHRALVTCPWHEDHSDSNRRHAYIFKDDDGYPGFFCHHDCHDSRQNLPGKAPKTVLDAIRWFNPSEVDRFCDSAYADKVDGHEQVEQIFASKVTVEEIPGDHSTDLRGDQEPEAKADEREKQLLPKLNARKRRGYRLADLEAMPAPRWLIKQHFSQDSLVQTYGPPGAGKSFVAIDQGLCIASGKPYLDIYPVHQGPVLYLSAEGNSGIVARIHAWMKHYTMPYPQDCVFVPFIFDIPNPPEIQAILDIINTDLGVMPVQIIIDTVARYYGPGIDENSTKDMSAFVRACDALREATGATINGVHHSGKDPAKKDRGNTALRGACDTIIAIEPSQGGGCLVSCDKQKNAEPFAPYILNKNVHHCGYNDDGDEITSCVFTCQDGAATRFQLLSKPKKDRLGWLWLNFRDNHFELKDVRDKFDKKNKGTLSRDLTDLAKSNVLTRPSQGGYTIPSELKPNLIHYSAGLSPDDLLW
jgi:hypothetical protein